MVEKNYFKNKILRQYSPLSYSDNKVKLVYANDLNVFCIWHL